MRRFATTLLRRIVSIFYRRIEVVGMEHVPSGPVIFAVNHPNGLIDPLFLLCFTPRPVSFLAKAPIFHYPVIGWLARVFDSIPVYRRQDNTKGSNRETFGRARELLARGGSIAIFPEGTTHSDAKLRELKTGAARIALGASSAETMHVVPAGIYYTAKHVFRSDALVVFGPPLLVRPSAVSEDGEPPADEVEGLTKRIEDALNEVTLQADSQPALELISRAERIFTAEEQSLASELAMRRRFVDGYTYLRQHDPARLATLESRITRFSAELGAAKLEPDELVSRIDGKALFVLIVFFPLAVLGAIVHYPTYRLVGFLSKRFAHGEEEVVATIKFIASAIFFPLTWLAAALIAWHFLGLGYGLAAMLVLPCLAAIAMRVSEELDDVLGRARAITTGRHTYERLRAERETLRVEIAEVADEMNRAT